MNKEYHIDFRHQLKSSEVCFTGLVWITISMIIGYFWINALTVKEVVIIWLLFWLITHVFMVLPFHIQYLLKNWRTKIIVNNKLSTIEVFESSKTYKYYFSDLKVYRYIGGHYRPDRTKSWIPIPFNNYGYLKIKTTDNMEFYITSLMMDPFNPPLIIEKTIYGFPFIETNS